MQFAGQRTDMDLNPVGEPVNVLIKLTPDVLPDPDAVLLTGITPQSTLQDGLTEAEFLRYFYDEVVKPDTTFLGYNSVRFDDEFMRFLHYRNFYDAYEWQWANGCSRWDVLDLVRMTRAVRPSDIKWPTTPDGKATNRLELLTKLNGLDHEHAHDALNDVLATIAIAKLIREKQPDLFSYLLEMRSKKKAAELVLKGAPFVYSSGHYPSQTLCTTAVVLLGKHTERDEALVYDLRHDPTPFFNMTVPELIEAWRFTKDPDALRLPVKTLKYNRCPAIAPLGVIKDEATQQRLDLSLDTISKNFTTLKQHLLPFAEKVAQAVAQLDKEREQAAKAKGKSDVDGQLYDGFFGPGDKTGMRLARSAEPSELSSLENKLQDERLKGLLPRYKARNFPNALTPEERESWDAFIAQKLFSGDTTSRLAQYFGRLQDLAKTTLTSEQQYLLEELQLYGQSIMPSETA